MVVAKGEPVSAPAKPEPDPNITSKKETIYLKCREGVVAVTQEEYSRGVERMIKWIR